MALRYGSRHFIKDKITLSWKEDMDSFSAILGRIWTIFFNPSWNRPIKIDIVLNDIEWKQILQSSDYKSEAWFLVLLVLGEMTILMNSNIGTLYGSKLRDHAYKSQETLGLPEYSNAEFR